MNLKNNLVSYKKVITDAHLWPFILIVLFTLAYSFYTPYYAIRWILFAIVLALLLRMAGTLVSHLQNSSIGKRATRYPYLLLFVAFVTLGTYIYGARGNSSGSVVVTLMDMVQNGKKRAFNLATYSNGKALIRQINQDRETQLDDYRKLSRLNVPLHLVPVAACMRNMLAQLDEFDRVIFIFVKEENDENKKRANVVRLETQAYLADLNAEYPGLLSDGKCDVLQARLLRLSLPTSL